MGGSIERFGPIMGGALIGQTAVDQCLGDCAKSHKESSIALGRKLHGRKLPLLGSLFGKTIK